MRVEATVQKCIGQRFIPALLTLLVLGTVAPPIAALKDDREQPIKISADSAERDERSQRTQYIGSVELVQGSLHIKADRLTVFHDKANADRIIAVGDPATLTQLPAVGDPPIEAEAGKIEYIRSEDLIKLTQTARIEQDGAVVTGDSIDYLITEQRVLARAGERIEGGQRVEVTIPPQVTTPAPAKPATPERPLPEPAVPETAEPISPPADDTDPSE
ncbi:lipopolysaccharide transport periplasmic protein LptA, putative [Luminiphilus syltensis NOR5-1B]|uniref:Lipopolysaccharide export system protein LptA n=1 Tax=Luminiphilus syltensis NOR5-1B TaxID=565045 RepID=B8KR84_9GAMM|nr:lipopolysaccharide transport periplasmic protein LptA [Luminiphilus syltensis]EED36209.1 lipopolysaccharide transport periplasmic protein LptA, putative [Luminiphilus syltensis NOR5-1B]